MSITRISSSKVKPVALADCGLFALMLSTFD
jgi:hypothetical protein